MWTLSVCKKWSNRGKNKRANIQEYSDITDHEIQKLRDKFRINTFFAINDKLLTELQKRNSANDNKIDLFGFLTRLDVIDDNLLKQSVNNFSQNVLS